MKQYLELLKTVFETGEKRQDRTGVGTVGIFGAQMRFDLSAGFPLLTTKKIHTRSIINELLWFLAGRTDNSWLRERGVTIWDEWSTAEQCARFGRQEGDLGPIYGHQWRNFGATENPDGTFANNGIDQIAHLIEEIKKNPFSRRLIVSGWNPAEADKVALPPCHTLFQFYVSEPGASLPSRAALSQRDTAKQSNPSSLIHKGGGRGRDPWLSATLVAGNHGSRLSCQLYQRSADLFLGVPFNIASYALLTHMIAQVCGLQVGDFVHTFGDVHIYANHFEQVRTQLAREPRKLPELHLNPNVKSIFDFKYEDVKIEGYDPHPPIKAPVAV